MLPDTKLIPFWTFCCITSQIFLLTTITHLSSLHFIHNIKIYIFPVENLTFTYTKFHLPLNKVPLNAAAGLCKILLQFFNLTLVFPFTAINKLSYCTRCTLFHLLDSTCPSTNIFQLCWWFVPSLCFPCLNHWFTHSRTSYSPAHCFVQGDSLYRSYADLSSMYLSTRSFAFCTDF